MSLVVAGQVRAPRVQEAMDLYDELRATITPAEALRAEGLRDAFSPPVCPHCSAESGLRLSHGTQQLASHDG